MLFVFYSANRRLGLEIGLRSCNAQLFEGTRDNGKVRHLEGRWGAKLGDNSKSRVAKSGEGEMTGDDKLRARGWGDALSRNKR